MNWQVFRSHFLRSRLNWLSRRVRAVILEFTNTKQNKIIESVLMEDSTVWKLAYHSCRMKTYILAINSLNRMAYQTLKRLKQLLKVLEASLHQTPTFIDQRLINKFRRGLITSFTITLPTYYSLLLFPKLRNTFLSDHQRKHRARTKFLLTCSSISLMY